MFNEVLSFSVFTIDQFSRNLHLESSNCFEQSDVLVLFIYNVYCTLNDYGALSVNKCWICFMEI